jgi:hypothetical protein
MAFETGHYGYGLIERALGAALGVDEGVQRGALRSRLKRLAQLGLPKSLEGREGRRLYSQEECHQMLVALLLGNIGLDPTVVARAVKKAWNPSAVVVRAVKKAWKQNLKQGAIEAAQEADAAEKKIGNPIVLYAILRVVSEPWRTGDPNTALTLVALRRRYNEDTWKLAKKRKMTDAEAARNADLLMTTFETLRPVEWSAMLNYTEAATDLHRALNRGE